MKKILGHICLYALVIYAVVGIIETCYVNYKFRHVCAGDAVLSGQFWDWTETRIPLEAVDSAADFSLKLSNSPALKQVSKKSIMICLPIAGFFQAKITAEQILYKLKHKSDCIYVGYNGTLLINNITAFSLTDVTRPLQDMLAFKNSSVAGNHNSITYVLRMPNYLFTSKSLKFTAPTDHFEIGNSNDYCILETTGSQTNYYKGVVAENWIKETVPGWKPQ